MNSEQAKAAPLRERLALTIRPCSLAQRRALEQVAPIFEEIIARLEALEAAVASRATPSGS